MSRIILHTELNAEDNAMLQALYSRSAASVTDHLKKLEEVGSSKFMSQYYLGYGHASIGDCGNETMYFEGISMLAAKAIEDNPLFVGQECSSRYIDFSTQPFHNPLAGTEEGDQIQELYDAYRQFYNSSLEPLKDALRARFPIKDGEKSGTYEKAIAARAFDILRGFLPTGATTNVAWTGRLSNAHEHLAWMMHHPLKEVRQLGAKAYQRLQAKYPNSFKLDYALLASCSTEESFEHQLRNIEGDEVFEYLSELPHFYETVPDQHEFNEVCKYPLHTNIYPDRPFETADWATNRQRKTKLYKHYFKTHEQCHIYAACDFGSFRDIQRHRNGYCSMPLIDMAWGVHPWYLDNLTDSLKNNALALLGKVRALYESLVRETDDLRALALSQYVLPMGMVVTFHFRYSIQEMLYVAELRSGKTVHATLRPIAQKMAKFLESKGIPVFYDKDENDWTIKRGEQDIVAKS